MIAQDRALIPRLLRADNLTPPSRTPWGGTRIRDALKAGLNLSQSDMRVGESWEVSVEPSFPSRMQDTNTLLSDVIGEAPEAWLGHEVSRRYGGQLPILVKLLDAADNLSVQVHPHDHDPLLGPDESGKPESWIILDAEPGAGLYLGFKDGVGRQDVSTCLRDGGALNTLMNFVPVHRGDGFIIEAGTPHAIGKGITLIEPQHVTPSKRGVTYRFWDWNRRYDADGRQDPSGAPRPLHLARSLDVTHWDGERGEAFVRSCRSNSWTLSEGALAHERLVSWPWFVVERLYGDGGLSWKLPSSLVALTAVAGRGVLVFGGREVVIRCGQSLVIPACLSELEVIGQRVELIATYAPVSDQA